MTALTLPSWFIPSAFEFGLARQTVQFRSPISGRFQSVDLLSDYWSISVTLPPSAFADAGQVEAFLNQLVGGTQSVLFYHLKRPTPVGTMRGSPMLASYAAQFANQISLSGAYTSSGGAATLKAGDMIGLNGQLLQVKDDAAGASDGTMTVNLVNRLRSSISAGAAITWDKPTAEFVSTETASKFVHNVESLAETGFSFVEAV
jgi:hypothetical protein